ncbi:hypothetical protein SAMN05216480_113102 [Pustulibacterium marinum]|uniref:Uncharacterized protein n=1 Tax=Pustulibacterium marinum TaxID=1224947 RepID=A0A1I7I816_9FLAO|nr:hypothetical protein [Pustulibacterium marinum]SFU69089.1 hypothetical protein SAMN05216480_113102 [Pustulibacterium marinum]
MFKTYILLCFFCFNASITFGQNKETSIDSLLQKGNTFYAESNFKKAREYYLNVLEKDSSNIDATFNLAACELSLDHKTEACIQFNNAYYLGADDARPIIKQYCGAIAYRNVMYSGDVDTVPTFQLENELLPLMLIPENFDGRFPPMELNP